MEDGKAVITGPCEEDIQDSDEGGYSSRSSIRRNLHQELNYRSTAFKRPSFNTRNVVINPEQSPAVETKDRYASFSFRKKSDQGDTQALPETPEGLDSGSARRHPGNETYSQLSRRDVQESTIPYGDTIIEGSSHRSILRSSRSQKARDTIIHDWGTEKKIKSQSMVKLTTKSSKTKLERTHSFD